MKLFLSLCLFLSACMTPALAASAETDALLQQLTQTKLSKMPAMVQQLEATGDESLLPVFRAWLAGDLHYIRDDYTLVVEVDVNGVDTFQDPYTQATIAGLTSKQVRKVKVNNKLRGLLRGVIARIQLTSSNADVRESAVRALLADIDDETFATLERIYPTEPNSDVRSMMQTALSIYTAQDQNSSQSARLAAIDVLGDSLENDVRNVLLSLERSDNPVLSSAATQALVSINRQVERYALVDQLFFGLSLGSVLLLASIGLAITFGVMGVINMAHGEMIMLGAYTTYVVQLLMPNYIDYSIWVAIPAAFLVSGLMGVVIERLVICRLHGRPLETLLATFGISLILQQLVRTIFSPLNRQVSTPSWMSGSWEINPVLSLTLNRLYILAFALLVFFALVMILKKSSLGLNVRAVSQNRNMAKAMGVKTEWVDAMTFGLGSGIAGIAGVALSQLTNVGPNLGQAYIIDSFMVVVFGGVGNLLGTLVAAFTLGIANKFLEPTTGAVLAAIFVLVFIILFIQKRPKGLFPQKGRAAE